MELVARATSLVHARPEEVFDVFVNPDKMKLFWFYREDDGLELGNVVTWYIGDGAQRIGFPIRVLELRPYTLIRVEWGDQEDTTEIRWIMEETEAGNTILTIEESGFAGSDEELIARALDSTGGFNQVIIAAKALLEHDAVINVVSDHV